MRRRMTNFLALFLTWAGLSVTYSVFSSITNAFCLWCGAGTVSLLDTIVTFLATGSPSSPFRPHTHRLNNRNMLNRVTKCYESYCGHGSMEFSSATEKLCVKALGVLRLSSPLFATHLCGCCGIWY